MIHNQTTLKTIIMEFIHAGFSNVTKCSATHVWYSFSLATFSASVMDVSYYHKKFITYISSYDGSMAPYVIHNTEQQLFYYEQHFCKKHYANGLECVKTLK
jgi:hypothetical protein